MEYYEGKVPKGNKTRWMMIKYQVECKTGNGFNQQKVLTTFFSIT